MRGGTQRDLEREVREGRFDQNKIYSNMKENYIKANGINVPCIIFTIIIQILEMAITGQLFIKSNSSLCAYSIDKHFCHHVLSAEFCPPTHEIYMLKSYFHVGKVDIYLKMVFLCP